MAVCQNTPARSIIPCQAARRDAPGEGRRGRPSPPALPANFSPTLLTNWLQVRQMIDANSYFVSRFFVAQLVPHLCLNVIKQAHDAVDADLVAHRAVIKFAVPQIIPLLNSADAPTQVVDASNANAVRLQGELRGRQQKQNSEYVGEQTRIGDSGLNPSAA